eukprot:10432392-Alexandrium_andersonii.AAC.1
MSASLVGSEMCIRDSIPFTPCNDAMKGAMPVGGRSAEGLRARRCPGGAPVSYTHLTLPTICSV